MVVESIPALSSMLVQQPSPVNGDKTWPSAMGDSKIARTSPFVQRVSKLIQQPAVSQAGPTIASREGTGPSINRIMYVSPETLAREKAEDELVSSTAGKANLLAGSGGLREARATLEPFFERHPIEGVARTLMDIDFREGDFVAAYKVAAPLIKRGCVDQAFLIRASLEAAKLGEVYPGQREYCVKQLGVIGPSAPNRNGPAAEAALSEILLAGDRSRALCLPALPLDMDALKVDPTNPVTCLVASNDLVAEYRYSDAIGLLKAALARAGDCADLKTAISQSIELDESYLRRVGDGKPGWPVTPATQPGPIHP